jgi:hypothetical protein
MKQLIRILIAALVAAAVATIVIQRDRLRQIDRKELVASIREAIESKMPQRTASLEEAPTETEETTEEEAADADAGEQASEG